MTSYWKPIALSITLIAVILWWLFPSANDGLYDEGMHNFAIEDTSAITSIMIWDRSPDTVILSKHGQKWEVNGLYPARKGAVDEILETLYRIRLRSIPQQAAVKNILTQLAVHGKQVTIYAGDQVVKQFQVGSETMDMLGTYMLMQGYSQPVATHIPGFNGFLSSRFFLQEDLWRSRNLFPHSSAIVGMSILYSENPQGSFSMNDQKQYTTISGLSMINGMASQAMVKAIQSAKYEGMIIPSDKVWNKLDSIGKTRPAILIEVSYGDGSQASMSCYHVPGGEDIIAADGTILEHDPDRFYALLSDGRSALVQRYGLQHLLKTSLDLGFPMQ